MSSSPLKIALVTEGPTDYVLLEKAIERIFETHDENPTRLSDFTLVSLQPELDENSRAKTGGWGGVYRWCRGIAERSGSAGQDYLLSRYDLLVIQLDADVADKAYSSAHINDAPVPDNLPCAKPCPPALNTTDALRKVLLGWLSETNVPDKFVLCTPSKALESWVLVALYPDDPTSSRNGVNFECRSAPQNILKGKPREGRLLDGNKKNLDSYKKRSEEFKGQWMRVCNVCAEARRFDQDVRNILSKEV